MTNYHILDDNFIKIKKKVEISMNDNDINEVIPIKDNDGRTVNLTNDRIQPHTNKKFEETKLKDEEAKRIAEEMEAKAK